jgi:hypothetical protein
MAGTTVKLAEKIKIPTTIDTNLFFTDDLTQRELTDLADGKALPKLWLLGGRPETEVVDLALYAASQGGDCEVIQIGAVGSHILEQLEAAKRNNVPVVRACHQIRDSQAA